MKSYLLCLLPALAAAQVCNCRPGWGGADCGRCFNPIGDWGATNVTDCVWTVADEKARRAARDPSGTDGPLELSRNDLIALASSDAYKKQVQWTVDQLQCYGHGLWNVTTSKCDCSTQTYLDGTTSVTVPSFGGPQDPYCQRCADGWLNWPACDARGCAGNPCDPRATCNDAPLKMAVCGNVVDNIAYYPAEQTCCTWKDLNGDLQQQVYTRTSKTCCGNAQCESTQVCEEYTTRVGGADVKRYQCLDKKQTKCPVKQYDLEAGWYVATYNGCEDHETCCNGACCSSTQTCEEYLGDTQLNYGVSATNHRLQWTLVDGSKVPEEHRTQCFDNLPTQSQNVMIYIRPVVLVCTAIIALIMVVARAGVGSFKVFIPAILIIFFAIPMLFSQIWNTGILIILSSLTAIGSQASNSKYKTTFSVGFQFLILVSLFNPYWASMAGQPSFLTARVQGALPNTFAAVRQCLQSFSFFDQVNPAWDDPTNGAAYGLCEFGFQSYLMFSAAVIIGLLVIQMVATMTLVLGDK